MEVCAIDTSGGITEEMFNHWILNAKTLNNIDYYLTFNYKICQISKNISDLKYYYFSGGTELNPVIEFCKNNCSNLLDLYIYSDGYIDIKKIDIPKWIHIHWMAFTPDNPL